MLYLVNPDEHKILENAGDRPPLGLMNIKAVNPKSVIYDLNHDSKLRLLRNIEEENPDAIGISVYCSPNYTESMNLLRTIKSFYKGKVFAGGYHATAMPESLKEFDSVIVGEGDVDGLEKMVLSDNKLIFPGLPDVSKERRLNGVDLWMYGVKGNKQGTVITSRGCPYSCAFCGKLSSNIRFENEQTVINLINDYREAGFDSIYFVDDVFTLKKDRMEKIVKNVKMPFRVTTRANLIDEEKMKILKDNGCNWLSLGIESGNDEILKRSNKRMTTKQNYDAVKLAGRNGIKVKGFFIIGLPGETSKTARDTIWFSEELREIGLKEADFYFLTPFPGTPIWKDPEYFGINIKDRDFTKYLQAGKNAKCYVDTEKLTSNQIENYVNAAKTIWKKS